MRKNYTHIKPLLIFFFILSFTVCERAFAQSKNTIQGRITDGVTQKPLENVSVIIKETKRGVVSNDSGYFNLPLPSRVKFTIVVSSVGYLNTSIPVDLSLHKYDSSLTITLKKKADAELDEVVINATRERSRVKTTEMNVVKINPDLIKRNLLLFGEADIIKTLILQPGITTAGEGAGGFNVRGGNADQNLVLIDGAPLFNTSHLLGFFTSVSPDAVQDVTLYKGGMPAQYGGRLSSLLNMKVKSGNAAQMQYTTGISPVSAHFFLNGPLVKNKLTVTAGLRAAYPNFMLNQFPGKFGDSRAFFYDGIAKAEYSFNTNTRLSITGYRSYDKFKFDSTTSYDWQSDLATVNFTSTITPKLTLQLNGNYSRFVSGINNLPRNYEFRIASSISQKQGKASLIYSLNDNHKIEAGVDYIRYDISPGNRKPNAAGSIVNALAIPNEQGREMAGFISDEISFTDKITLQAGLRYAVYDYLGPKTVYQYRQGLPLSKETITDSISYTAGKSIQRYSGFEPRVSLKVGITEELSLKLSYNRGQQFLHLVSNTTAISPVDFWKLSDNYIKAQRGDQYAAGIFKSFDKGAYELSVETYYRTINNTVDYKDGATLLLNPYIESGLLTAKGRGYGVELSFSKTAGKFTGQFNYSYSKSQVQIVHAFPSEQVNNGDYYPSNSDRPHNLAIITKLKLGGGWSFNADFVYTSGRPATYPDGNYAYNGTIVTNYSKRNLDRLPAYHRLDAGFSYVSRRYSDQKKYSIWNISFYNLYMRKNAYSIYFQRNGVLLQSYRLSVVGSIIPSVSWTYNF